jgi:hypothetical protein
MNERIRELAREAGFYANPDIEKFEKFAQLIVKECADVAKRWTPETEECEYTWLIHDKIKEHFGVKE